MQNWGDGGSINFAYSPFGVPILLMCVKLTDLLISIVPCILKHDGKGLSAVMNN